LKFSQLLLHILPVCNSGNNTDKQNHTELDCWWIR